MKENERKMHKYTHMQNNYIANLGKINHFWGVPEIEYSLKYFNNHDFRKDLIKMAT
jgi:hypothetical protein